MYEVFNVGKSLLLDRQPIRGNLRCGSISFIILGNVCSDGPKVNHALAISWDAQMRLSSFQMKRFRKQYVPPYRIRS
jgi:hypothetical protein